MCFLNSIIIKRANGMGEVGGCQDGNRGEQSWKPRLPALFFQLCSLSPELAPFLDLKGQSWGIHPTCLLRSDTDESNQLCLQDTSSLCSIFCLPHYLPSPPPSTSLLEHSKGTQRKPTELHKACVAFITAVQTQEARWGWGGRGLSHSFLYTTLWS